MKLDYNAVLQWYVSDAENHVSSKAWETMIEVEQNKMQFLADLVRAVNETTSGAAKAVCETVAKAGRR